MNPEIYQRHPAIKQLCQRMIMDHPDAICMAMIVLDCGCVNVCGVSAVGRPVGPVTAYARPGESEIGKGPICLQCAGAGAPVMQRIVHRTLVWPGDDAELPDRELRNLIGREVFGNDYKEPA